METFGAEERIVEVPASELVSDTEFKLETTLWLICVV
jgi:hypothetical protein